MIPSVFAEPSHATVEVTDGERITVDVALPATRICQHVVGAPAAGNRSGGASACVVGTSKGQALVRKQVPA